MAVKWPLRGFEEFSLLLPGQKQDPSGVVWDPDEDRPGWWSSTGGSQYFVSGSEPWANPSTPTTQTSAATATPSGLAKGEFGPDEAALAETLRLNRTNVMTGGGGLDAKELAGLAGGIYKEASGRQLQEQYVDIARGQLDVAKQNAESNRILAKAGMKSADAAEDEASFGLVGDVIGAGVSLATGGTVICTALNRYGFIPDDIYEAECEYVKHHIDLPTYLGYRMWAKPIVTKMQFSSRLVKVLAPFGRAFASEAAHRVDSKFKGSLLGTLMILVGVPFFKFIFFRNQMRRAK